jgi:two-component system cell cycle response regulator
MCATSIPRVLVVDDLPQVRQLFGRFLALAGMVPSFAADGLEGLSAASASRPDLVLCDLEMPRMDGIALCAALRADAATRRLPIVVVTASGAAAAAAATAAGCDAVLSKPVSRALLLATVRDLLARTEAARVAAATAPLSPPAEPR